MAKRTLLIKQVDGTEIQVDIPEEWKVTFGPAAVGMEKHQGRVPMALRIYESEKMQRAIFTEVTSFRDMSIPYRVKRVNTQEKDGYIECDGVRKHTAFRASTVEWVTPDTETEEEPKLIQMPSDGEMFNTIETGVSKKRNRSS